MSHRPSSNSGGLAATRPSQVCVYVAIDVSISMKGSKLREVCSSIQEILNEVPDDVLFDINLFSATSWKIVTALKSAINPSEITQTVKDSCGSQNGTALYDAWGDLLMSIEDAVWRKEIVQICILTDGEDNCSKRYTHASVLQLMKDKMNSRTTFNFVQAGKRGNTQVVQSLKQICNTSQGRVKTLEVDDNATGIKTAMTSVRHDILKSTRGSLGPQTGARGTRPSGLATIYSQNPSHTTGASQRNHRSDTRGPQSGNLGVGSRPSGLANIYSQNRPSTNNIGGSVVRQSGYTQSPKTYSTTQTQRPSSKPMSAVPQAGTSSASGTQNPSLSFKLR